MQICSSAVKESLSYVFGHSFDVFGRNFEKSFQCTLQTLRLVNESSSQASVSGHVKSRTRQRSLERAPHPTFYKQEDSTCSYRGGSRQLESVGIINNASIQPNVIEDTEDRVMNQQLTLHRSPSDQQLARVSSSKSIFNSEHNQSMISTFRKSVLEQSRSNDLKELELGFVQKRLQLEEKQLDLMSEANSLGRSKLSMSYSMAFFKAGKFKIELEDTRRAELLRQCIDCLVFGLVVMLSCLGYGIYIFTFARITDATSACTPSMNIKSWWWKPKVVTTLNSGMQLAWCYTQAFSRIMFAISMIVVIIYLLIQRSASSNQTMPLTFIVLILGVAVGIVGKLCIDTLGGSGYHWLLHWEVLCFLHFLSIIWTNILYRFLYGPVTPFEDRKSNVLSPYVIRRISYYMVMLLILPLLCGLLPFATLGEWRDHFSSLIMKT
ncbi:hypothetical protein Leryth_025351 [Lithospermum erythrorhizon]|nr:hypothetical protein Leryth_025351 [Lithospermum erythrorhizon]